MCTKYNDKETSCLYNPLPSSMNEIFQFILIVERCTFRGCLAQGGEHQKSFRQSVSAWVVACLAVITLIKDCQPNFEFT